MAKHRTSDQGRYMRCGQGVGLGGLGNELRMKRMQRWSEKRIELAFIILTTTFHTFLPRFTPFVVRP